MAKKENKKNKNTGNNKENNELVKSRENDLYDRYVSKNESGEVNAEMSDVLGEMDSYGEMVPTKFTWLAPDVQRNIAENLEEVTERPTKK